VTDKAKKAVHICSSTHTPGADEKSCGDCNQTIYSTDSGVDTDNGEWSANLSEEVDEQIFVCPKCGMKRAQSRGVAG
jgi:hypothetical protein